MMDLKTCNRFWYSLSHPRNEVLFHHHSFPRDCPSMSEKTCAVQSLLTDKNTSFVQLTLHVLYLLHIKLHNLCMYVILMNDAEHSQETVLNQELMLLHVCLHVFVYLCV